MATTVPESHQDLLKSDVAMLATVGKDGTPQVTAIWFLQDSDGQVKLSLNAARQKVKNLEAAPNCTLFFLDRANPFRTLEIRGRADVSPDPNYEFADKVGKKYGADLRRMDKPGESRVVVTVRPTRVVAIDLSRR